MTRSDNGAAAATIEAQAPRTSPGQQVAATIDRLVKEIEIGKVTPRVALHTLALKAMRAGRDFEIAAQREALANPLRAV